MSSSTDTPDSATPHELPAATRRKVTDIFTRDEIRMLTERSDAMGFLAVGFTWAVIVGTLALLAWASSLPLGLALPLYALGLVVLGGRHLALAILMHEASHKTLFKTLWLNEVFADWVCAKPIWNDVRKYRAHHFVHHNRTGQPDDSDLSLVTGLPCTRASLWRKFARDVSGLTGLKFLFGRALMDAGVIKWTVSNDVQRLPRRHWLQHARSLIQNSAPALLVNGLLFGVCWLAGYPWLFGFWALSYLTPFPLFIRIRSLAEHACTETSLDMFRNTRSTRAGLLARMTVAPIRVNFHIEHHVLASVPYYRLERMHRMLRERGAVDAPPGYWDVLRIVTTPSEAATA
ncbi:MAG TPA: fatty acid desaturase family protein [Polyangiales bacterium]